MPRVRHDIGDAGMKRRLLNLLTALSMLLCVAVCVLWVRSFGAVDTLQYVRLADAVGGRSTGIAAASLRGRVKLSVSWWPKRRGERLHTPSGWRAFSERLQPGMLERAPPDMAAFWWRLGFGRRWDDQHRRQGDRFLVLPYWPLFTLSLLPPVSAGRRWLRCRDRSRKGLCPACGYDLRASPGRCPECGSAAAIAG